jgi:hypothetical protein
LTSLGGTKEASMAGIGGKLVIGPGGEEKMFESFQGRGRAGLL